MKSINELVCEAHLNAKAKGWHDENRSFGEEIALCHSELSEALEDYRVGERPDESWYEFNHPSLGVLTHNTSAVMEWGGENHIGKLCGIPSELADVVIRIFDMCGKYGIDLEAAIEQKMLFNSTRPHRHGGKVL